MSFVFFVVKKSNVFRGKKSRVFRGSNEFKCTRHIFVSFVFFVVKKSRVFRGKKSRGFRGSIPTVLSTFGRLNPIKTQNIFGECVYYRNSLYLRGEMRRRN